MNWKQNFKNRQQLADNDALIKLKRETAAKLAQEAMEHETVIPKSGDDPEEPELAEELAGDDDEDE